MSEKENNKEIEKAMEEVRLFWASKVADLEKRLKEEKNTNVKDKMLWFSAGALTGMGTCVYIISRSNR